MDVGLDRLNAAKRAMLKVIKNRPDGRTFVPFVQRLERAISEYNADELEVDRIMRMAEKL